MALADTARLAVQIDLEGNAAAGINKLNRQVQGLGKSVGRMGRGVGQVGAGFARAGLLVGGAAIAGLTAAAKAGIDFEDAFAGVRKTVDEADLKSAGLTFEGLAKQFRDMATEMPLAATEFARLGEIAGALGVKAKDIKEFTRVTALMGVTTNLTADAAADAFGRIGTILGLTGDDYQEFAESIVALGNAGASTEAEITEITKRFAATAKQAGLTKEQMVGLASATASLGFEPERGGTALARVFANMATNISLANAKGKALSKAIGKPIKTLQRDIDRGKGLPIFLDLLREIRDMKPTEAARFLKSIGVTNVSDRTVFLAMSQQLPFINEQLEIANESQGALLKEAEKKFATTASKIQIFKNNLIEAGIALSEGFLPAVGRSLDKLTAAFKDPSTKADIKKLGEDIGAAIDDIDWDAVLRGAKEFVGVLKGALSFVLLIVEAVNKLPTEIKAAGAGFLALDKLSGGLVGAGVGNILGGAAQGVLSRTPGVGKLFAQPVFVTNWPIGFGGPDLLNPTKIGTKIGDILKLGLALTVAGAIVSAAIPIGEAFANALPPELKGQGGLGQSESQRAAAHNAAISSQSTGDFLADLSAGLARLFSNPPRPVPAHGGRSPDERQERADTAKRIAALALQEQRAGERTVSSITDTRTAIAETTRETTRGAMATQAVTRAASQTNAAIVASATRSSAGAIIAAIYAARPVINVTHVTRNNTIQNRYGPGTGSYGQPAHDLI